jgi:hypothetical protein
VQISKLLAAEGWRHAPDPDEEGGTAFEREGVRLDLTFLMRAESVGVFTPMRDGPAFWGENVFADDVVGFRGVLIAAIPFETLKAMKAFVRPEAGDAAKDRVDLEQMSRLA